MSTKDRVYLGQAIYSNIVLSIYDIFVLGITNSFIWECPTRKILSLYNDNISPNHLDVGVGTGYFLDKCVFTENPRIGLMDLNENCLKKAQKRIHRYQTETYRHNVLQPFDNGENIPKFDSLALNYLLHCVPGNLRDKSIIFKNLRPLCKENAKVFGSTVLSSLNKNKLASHLMHTYNQKGIFNNADDSLEDLESTLKENLQTFDIKTSGCVALFSGVF